MRSVGELDLLPVWVQPEHLVASALLLMRGHGIRVIAVLEHGRLAGFLSLDRALGANPEARVADVMVSGGDQMDATASVRKAADLFMSNDLDHAAVFSDAGFLGVLTPNLLLRELRRSWDPLTGLSWSDRLRDWGVEMLRAGREISILFIDLDNFRDYNKKHGHIVGDRVLRGVAEALRNSIDPERDILVRYGGDEFAVGSIRAREEIHELTRRLRDEVYDLFIEGLDEAVTVSVGTSGGKRTKERENVHYAATLDALINLASKDAQAQKKDQAVKAVVSVAPAPERPSLVSVSVEDLEPDAPTTVYLQASGAVLSGVALRLGRTTVHSVAMATASALERLRPGVSLIVDDVSLLDSPARTVAVSGRMVEGEHTTAVTAAIPLAEDLYQTVVKATIDAFLGPA